MAVTDEVREGEPALLADLHQRRPANAPGPRVRGRDLHGRAGIDPGGRSFGTRKRAYAHVIRNAGGIVTDDALRSLVISHHLLGTQEALVIGHSGLRHGDVHERRAFTTSSAGGAHERSTSSPSPMRPPGSAESVERDRGVARSSRTSFNGDPATSTTCAPVS